MKRPVLTASAALLLACVSFPALALQIFVSNEKDNTVTVIDGKTLQSVKTIPTARRRAASSPAPMARKFMSQPAMATSWK